jgi:hypothetical protein
MNKNTAMTNVGSGERGGGKTKITEALRQVFLNLGNKGE